MKKIQWPNHQIVTERLDDDWENRLKAISVRNGVYYYKYQSSSSDVVYDIRVKFDGSDIMASCTCPFGIKKSEHMPCKHIMAAVVAIEKGAIDNERIMIWPSSIDMISLCPASRATEQDEIVIDHIGDMANVGRAIHAMAEKVVSGHDIESAAEIAAKFNVESHSGDIEYLVSAVLAAWKKLSQYFRSPFVERKMSLEYQAINPYTMEPSTVVLSGRIDVGEVFEDELSPYAIALDWKTGRKDEEDSYIGQMKGYAALMFANNDAIETVTVMIVWLRSREFSSIKFSRDEIAKWFAGFVKHSVFWDGKTYKPGPHCSWCSRFYDCPARKKEMSSAIELFVGNSSSVVDPDSMYHGYKFAKSVIKIAQEFIDQIKAETRKRGGIPIPEMGGDRGFVIKKRSGRKIVKAEKARPILEKYLERNGVDAISSISITKLKKALMEVAPRGQKKDFLDKVIEELESNGGLETSRDAEYLTIGNIDVEGEDNDG